MVLRSAIRHPFEQPDRLFVLRVPEDRADYLLRAWPRPACYRRVWGGEHWLDFEPPLESWQGDERWRATRERRRSRRAAGTRQMALGLHEGGAALDPGGLAGFWAGVPEDLRALVLRLPTARWSALRVAAEDPRVHELLLANAALGILLTDRGLEAALGRRLYERRVLRDRLLGLRQHRALGELGFPARRSFRRLLQRMAPEAVSVCGLLELRRVHRMEELNGLALPHVGRVHAGVLELVLDDVARAFVHPRLLQEVAARDEELRESETAQLLRDSVLMLRTLDRPHGGFRPRSVEELRAVHDELLLDMQLHADAVQQREAERRRARWAIGRARRRGANGRMAGEDEIMDVPPLEGLSLSEIVDVVEADRGRDALQGLPPQEPVAEAGPDRGRRRRVLRARGNPPAVGGGAHAQSRWDQRWTSDVDFGEPPVPETDSVRWVRTARALNSAAVRLRNCAASYRNEVLSGRYAIYVVTGPQEGMVGLRRTALTHDDDTPIWAVAEIKGAGNASLGPTTMRVVREWAHQGGVHL